MPPQAFLAVIEAWNTIMDDLHRRFPKLRGIRPPNLSQNDLGAETPGLLGRYKLKSSTLQFTNPFSIHWGRYSEDRKNDSFTSPKREGFEGIVLHEYAHHLRAEMLPDPRRWLTGLAAFLKENGYIDDDSKIDITPAFAVQVGKQAREMGLGYYAGRNAEEFTAEALAWRLSPDYGAVAATPRMPRHLEDWIHECFPFVLDGPNPESTFEFDPASIREPWMYDGRLGWRNRGPVPVPPPRCESLRQDSMTRAPQQVDHATSKAGQIQTTLSQPRSVLLMDRSVRGPMASPTDGTSAASLRSANGRAADRPGLIGKFGHS